MVKQWVAGVIVVFASLLNVIALAQVDLQFVEVAKGFNIPTDFRFDPESPKVIWVTEKTGNIRVGHLGEKFETIATVPEVVQDGELGLLSLAFDPKASFLWIYFNKAGTSSKTYTSTLAKMQIKRSKDRFPSLGPAITVLEFIQKDKSNIGSQIQFGPDGMLYMGFGDNDLFKRFFSHSQNLTTLQGKIIRIDVHCDNSIYCIPSDNPLVQKTDTSLRKEIYAWGIRNAWRMSFDHKGRLVVGDVGHDRYEEISVIVKGGNFGWPYFEGSERYLKNNHDGDSLTFIPPLLHYDHQTGTAIIAGYEVTHLDSPLYHHYVFSDFGSGKFWSFPVQNSYEPPVAFKEIGQLDSQPITFGIDPQGELYVADMTRILKLNVKKTYLCIAKDFSIQWNCSESATPFSMLNGNRD